MGAGADPSLKGREFTQDGRAVFDGYDPSYQSYYMSAYPFARNPEDIWKYNPLLGGGAAYDPMGYAEWQALRGSVGPGQTPNAPPPVAPPAPTDNLLGLMKQSADPWGTYGQMGVNEPYLSNINNRFGWSSQGLAYPTQLQASPTWYNPPIVYPDVVQPSLKAKTTTTTTDTTRKDW